MSIPIFRTGDGADYRECTYISAWLLRCSFYRVGNAKALIAERATMFRFHAFFVNQSAVVRNLDRSAIHYETITAMPFTCFLRRIYNAPVLSGEPTEGAICLSTKKQAGKRRQLSFQHLLQIREESLQPPRSANGIGRQQHRTHQS